jgi:hypothetical protein
VIVPAEADRRRRFRLRLLGGFLAILLIAYARQFFSSPTVGQDFRAFYAGAVVLRAGGNPYDWSELGATENALYNAPHHLRGGDPGYYDFLPLPEGPWLLMALVPLTVWPWPVANAVYTSLLLGIIVAGSWLILRHFGWNGRPLALGLLVVTLSPVVFINLFLGQATPIIFGAMAAAMALAGRGRPGLAGLVLAAVWIKPNLGLALPVVVGLYQTRVVARLLAGFAIGTAGAFAIAGAVLGGAVMDWPRGVIQVWRAVQGPQPDIASLHTFYYPLLGGWPKTAALVLACLLIAAYGVWALRRSPARPLSGMTFLLLWLCAIPYAHSFDAILLLPVLAILAAPTLAGLKDVWVEACLWAFAIFPLLYFVGAHIGPLNGFGAIPVALTAWAWHRRIVAPSPAPLQMAA